MIRCIAIRVNTNDTNSAVLLRYDSGSIDMEHKNGISDTPFVLHCSISFYSMANLGWVDFDFGCSTLCLVLPGLMGNWQNWLSS